jgi:hypothetical protein
MQLYVTRKVLIILETQMTQNILHFSLFHFSVAF